MDPEVEDADLTEVGAAADEALVPDEDVRGDEPIPDVAPVMEGVILSEHGVAPDEDPVTAPVGALAPASAPVDSVALAEDDAAPLALSSRL